jgi:CHAT domain-containing protein
LAIFERSLGVTHPNLAHPLINLAALFAERGDWAAALALHKRAKPILTDRAGVDINDRTEIGKNRLAGNAGAFRAHARATYRADGDGIAAREEGFEAAQWALQTTAADALTQIATRFAKKSGHLATLVRERQDLVISRRAEDKRLLDAVGKADMKATEAIRATMVSLDGKLDAIDKNLAKEFPEYAEFSRPKPLSIGAVQALLRPDEALIVFLDILSAGKLSEETLAWAVTNVEARWISIPLGTVALAERVAKLRCGLDREGQWKWSVRRWEAKSEHCRTLKPDGLADDEPLPFDFGVAHELYTLLLAPFSDLTEGKSLIVVPSGPLTSVPFHVLVTEAPKAAAQQEHTPTAWLALKQPVTMLPSVGSLQALRKLPASQAKHPYIAFGNPLLDGGAPNGIPAKLARIKQSCPSDTKSLRHRIVDAGKSVADVRALFRGAIDLAELRGLAPLPETADELCAVARALGALDREADTVWLGERATETNLKALSRTGTLAQYGVLHFATHGVLAGESEEFLKARAEPALILSPPKDGTARERLEEDDGLLSASEVAQLELDADWVVLSACNTAAGEKGNAEALSGLARAFFYAKARALLVSHWAVASDAAVKLTTGTFDELRAAPKIGRAEALRRSMKRLIRSGRPHEAHPEYWAPFVVVGEGAR